MPRLNPPYEAGRRAVRGPFTLPCRVPVADTWPMKPEDVTDELLMAVRSELSDLGRVFTETLTADGKTNEYEVHVAPVDAASTSVWLDGQEADEASYAVEESSGKIIFLFVPPEQTAITVHGLHYRFFTDDELRDICARSFDMHVNGRTDSTGRVLVFARMDAGERYPLALLCTINALYVLATDAAFDIDIQAPDGLFVPRSQRYQHLMELIEALKARYRELSSLMGVGLYAIEVFTFRRISKRTNRYVPVYRPQEIDDRSPPERLRLPIPTYGAEVEDDGVPDMDITVYQGDTFAQEISLGFPIPADATFRAQIRGYAGSPVVAAEFAVTRVMGKDSDLFLLLTSEQTENLPRNCVWDIQMSRPVIRESDFDPADFDPDDFGPEEIGPPVVTTLFRGRVFAPKDVTTRGGTPPVPVTGVITNVYPPTVTGYQQNQTTWSQAGLP